MAASISESEKVKVKISESYPLYWAKSENTRRSWMVALKFMIVTAAAVETQ